MSLSHVFTHTTPTASTHAVFLHKKNAALSRFGTTQHQKKYFFINMIISNPRYLQEKKFSHRCYFSAIFATNIYMDT